MAKTNDRRIGPLVESVFSRHVILVWEAARAPCWGYDSGTPGRSFAGPKLQQLNSGISASNLKMRINPQKAIKPIRKVRKLLKDFPSEASPEKVHDLRTNCRKIEAIARAIVPDRKQGRMVVKAIQPLRKAAGHVRDLDVLIGKAIQVGNEVSTAHLTALVERMGEKRARTASKLHKLTRKHEKSLWALLKEFERDLEEHLAANGNTESPAAAQVLAAQLDHWPKLHAETLHDFRVQAKQLRYILRLSPDSDATELQELTQVKDTSGEWHDWLELEQMAREVFGEEEDAGLLNTLRKRTREKLCIALTTANALRKKGVGRLLHV